MARVNDSLVSGSRPFRLKVHGSWNGRSAIAHATTALQAMILARPRHNERPH